MRVVGSWGLGIFELARCSVRNFVGHGMPTHASALAYQGLFALFPFVISLGVLLVVLQIDVSFDRLIEQVRSQPPQQLPGPLKPVLEQMQSSLPEEALVLVVQSLVEQGQQVAESALPFGVVFFAIWSASGVAWTLLEALNVVHGVEETRPLWRRVALSVVFAPVLAGVVIVATGLLMIGQQLAEWLAGRIIGLDETFVALWWWFRLPIALFLLMLAVSAIYHFVPNTDRPFRFVASGAVVAVLAWALASLGFSYYLANFANYGTIYGGLGAAVALLAYLYLSAAALLLGAEVNEAVYRHVSE